MIFKKMRKVGINMIETKKEWSRGIVKLLCMCGRLINDPIEGLIYQA